MNVHRDSFRRRLIPALAAVVFVFGCNFTAWADSPQQFSLSETEFLQSVFGSEAPTAERVWIRGELKQKIEAVLQHRVGFLRSKYWQQGNRSVWILDEIGKERPITTGLVIEHNEGISMIVDIKVLAYRESRGWEVKQRFFTRQFHGASLRDPTFVKHGLDRSVDGITGATLSVRALKKVAEIALILDQHVRA